MFTKKGLFASTARAAAVAAIVAMGASTVAPTAVQAAPVKGATASHGTSDATDFSARRRHYRGNGNAAGLAAFAAIAGTIGVIAANQNRRDYYYDRGPGYYGGGQVYYQGGPGYYGGGPAYYGGGPYRGYGGGYGYDNARRMTW